MVYSKVYNIYNPCNCHLKLTPRAQRSLKSSSPHSCLPPFSHPFSRRTQFVSGLSRRASNQSGPSRPSKLAPKFFVTSPLATSLLHPLSRPFWPPRRTRLTLLNPPPKLSKYPHILRRMALLK